MKNKKILLILALIIIAIGIVEMFLMINGGGDSTDHQKDEQKNLITADQEAESEKYFEWNGTKITSLTEEGQNQKTLIIPSKCTEIEGYVMVSNQTENLIFAQGGKLTSIENIELDGAEKLKKVDMSGLNDLTEIPEYYFRESTIEEIKLPKSITIIGKEAFNNSEKLKSINLEELDKLTEIPENCFNGLLSIEQIKLPTSITSIGKKAFSGCENLKSVNLQDTSIITIGKSAFSFCKLLQEVILPSTLKTIEPSAFSNCDSITKLELPKGLETIEDEAFSGCASLTTIKLPETVTTLGDNAMQYCEKLEKVYLPESLTTIGDRVFINSPKVVIYVKDGSYSDQHYSDEYSRSSEILGNYRPKQNY